MSAPPSCTAAASASLAPKYLVLAGLLAGRIVRIRDIGRCLVCRAGAALPDGNVATQTGIYAQGGGGQQWTLAAGSIEGLYRIVDRLTTEDLHAICAEMALAGAARG